MIKKPISRSFWITAIFSTILISTHAVGTGWEHFSDTPGSQTKEIIRADFDNDGLLDIAYIETDGYLYVRATKQRITRKYHVCYQAEPTAMIHGDFDGKQGLDIITGDANGDIYLFHNNGQGNFSQIKKTKLGHSGSRVLDLGAGYKVAEQDYDLIATFADQNKAVLKNIRQYYEKKLFLINM